MVIPRQEQRRHLIILFFTLVVVMLGFGMMIPILPFYVSSFGASGSSLGLLMATYALMQLLFAPVWGSLSDRVGRRPILMLGVLGNALTQLLFGLASSLWMLFAARALAGVLSSATLPTAMAFIGDSTSKEQRGGGMGIMGAAMGVGMVLGPGLAGFLATESLALPFFLAAGLSLVALILVGIFLPESLPPEARSVDQRGLRGPSFALMWQALLGPTGFLFLLALLLSFGLTNFEGIFGLYALTRYAYGTEAVGSILTMIGLVAALVQGLLTGVLTRKLGEVVVIWISLAISAVGFLLMVLADTYVAVVLTVCFFIVGNALLRPSVASLISKRASTGQGVAMGLNNSFMSLGRIAGPTWAGFVFDVNIHYPYISGAVIMGIALAASLFRLRPTRVLLKTPSQIADGD
jgi:DHA1 family multidrug resistance protein-like MFS transporter